MKLSHKACDFELLNPFVISRGSKTHARVIEVSVEQDGHIGLGEGVPYARYGESVESVISQLETLPKAFSRYQLQALLPPGAARNAVDCALWDLEAKLTGTAVWQLAKLPEPKPLTMGETISLGTAEQMLESARQMQSAAIIKLKLGGQDDAKVLKQIRDFAPNPRLLVDVNEGWSQEKLQELLPLLTTARVEVLEQPVSDADSDCLDQQQSGSILCADESLHPGQDLQLLLGKYQMVNIKLDKAGGLTGAIEQVARARQRGLKVMIGCMASSSLSIAPAYLLAQLADLVDLDGFSLLKSDRDGGFEIAGGEIRSTSKSFWG